MEISWMGPEKRNYRGQDQMNDSIENMIDESIENGNIVYGTREYRGWDQRNMDIMDGTSDMYIMDETRE